MFDTRCKSHQRNQDTSGNQKNGIQEQNQTSKKNQKNTYNKKKPKNNQISTHKAAKVNEQLH